MQLLKELSARADQAQVTDEELVQGFPLEAGDRVVGILRENLRRLYSVFVAEGTLLQGAEEALEAEWDAIGPTDEQATQKRADISHRQSLDVNHYNTMKELFWGSVRLAFPQLIGRREISIRRGWQVVFTDDDGDGSEECLICPMRRTCPNAGSSNHREQAVQIEEPLEVNLLADILAGVETAQVPDEMNGAAELQDGDKVVGALPEELRKFYAVLEADREACNKVINQLSDEVKVIGPAENATPEQRRSVRQRYEVARLHHRVVKDLFWKTVRRDLPDIVDAECIGIRKGWQVVITHPPRPSDLVIVGVMSLVL